MKKNSFLSTLMHLTVVTGLLVGLTGCLGYNLGTTLQHDISTIAVPTFVNETTEPLLEVQTTDATIAQFQFDGSLRVVKEDMADAVLTVTLSQYKLYPITYDADKTTKADEYRVRVFASIELVRLSTDEVIVENPKVVGETTFYLVGDMSSSKRKALPDLSDDSANHR